MSLQIRTPIRVRARNSDLPMVLVLLLPYFAFLVVFKVLPLLVTLFYSFMELDLIGGGTFTGLDNYQQLLGDELFYKATANTFQYLLYVGPVNVVVGFLIALLLNARLKGRVVGRTLVFLPYVIMVTLVGITWRWILDGSNGLLNHYLDLLGIGPIPFLTDADTAMLGVAVASIWWTIGYNVIIYLAALQDIPAELTDAAAMDGAGPLRTLWSVVIPLMKRTTFFVVVTTVIYSLQMFGQVYVMTSGGPSFSTLSLVQYLYIKGFKEFDLGYASTIGMGLLVIVGALSVVVFLLLGERDDTRGRRPATTRK
jgi:ABC-type sugar transport system permease subunit